MNCNVLEDLNLKRKVCFVHSATLSLSLSLSLFFYQSDRLDESAKGLEVLVCYSGERT